MVGYPPMLIPAVSTHSRLKAAGRAHVGKDEAKMFQHTAA